VRPFDTQKFGQLLAQQLDERLSFDRLFQYSEPKRVARSHTVRGPSLQVDALRDGFSWYFNAKSQPSTTGLRQKCYIRFFKPNNPELPLEQVDCQVDCTCPDYRYRWGWSNKQRGSSTVGQQSLNKAFNRAPRITNPGNRPGLCKHLLALRDFIYGKYSTWNWTGQDTPSKLDRLIRYADNRIIRGETLAAQQANLARRKAQGELHQPETDAPDQQPTGTRQHVLPGTQKEGAVKEKKVPTGHRGPNLGGIQPQVSDSVVRRMDAQPILDDLKLVEAEVKDEELLKLLRQFFTIFKKLADEVEPEDSDEVAKLDLPLDSKEVDPITGKPKEDGEEKTDGDREEQQKLHGQPVTADK